MPAIRREPSCCVPFDLTLGRIAVLFRAQATDAAKHSREITLIFESDLMGNFPDPDVWFLQFFLCHIETQSVDQRPIRESVGRKPSGQGAH